VSQRARHPLTAVFSASILGGSELFNLEFLRTARSFGVQIDAVVPSEGALAEALRPLVHSLLVVEVPTALTTLSRFDRRVPLRTLPQRLMALRRYASQLRLALQQTAGPICSLGFRSQLAVAIAGRDLGRQACWVVHELVPPGPFARLWGMAANRVDSIFAYSRAAASQPALANAHVAVFPVRLELESFFGLALPSPPPRVLGLVGDLFPLKNQLGFVDVVRRLRSLGEPVEGRLFGRDTSASNRTAEYVEAVRSATGPDVQLREVEPSKMPMSLAELDLLLHLSVAPETFGRVCVEAMAAGRPVIGFEHGAVAEIIDSGRTGILCPVNNLDAVEWNVRRLRSEPQLYRQLSISARAAARDRWGPGQRGPFIGDALAAFAAGEEWTRPNVET
jgi:glycosyltransferase involved in cell wall biosynthesis